MKLDWADYFIKHPCQDCWLAFSSQTPHAFWNTTQRSDWLWWWLRFNRQGYLPPKAMSIKFAHDCSERIQIYATTTHAADYTSFSAANYAAATAAYAHDAACAATAEEAANYAAATAAYAHAAAYAATTNKEAATLSAEAHLNHDANELAWQANWIRAQIQYPFEETQ